MSGSSEDKLPGYEEASERVAAVATRFRSRKPDAERVALAGAAGRVLAASLRADQDQPPFARSTRDGFACRAAEASAHRPLPVAGSTQAGESAAGPLPPGAAWEIMTGAPVPPGADAVVMVEHVDRDGNAVTMQASRTIAAGENVVAQGAQARAGDELLTAGTALGAAQIALAAACGEAAVEVYRMPRVAILTTGDELVGAETMPGPGQIRNSNAPMLAALVAQSGGTPWVLPTAADTAEALDHALQRAMEADMLLISGGVSAGKFDLVEPALARLGARFYFTGVRIQPGKPLVFGELPRGEDVRSMPFFGLPGNPVSSAVTFLVFAARVLAALAGGGEAGPRFALARLKTDVKSTPGLTRFLPARWEMNPPQVATIPWHGSGDLAAFARSNCFVAVPEQCELLEAGTVVRILIF